MTPGRSGFARGEVDRTGGPSRGARGRASGRGRTRRNETTAIASTPAVTSKVVFLDRASRRRPRTWSAEKQQPQHAHLLVVRSRCLVGSHETTPSRERKRK